MIMTNQERRGLCTILVFCIHLHHLQLLSVVVAAAVRLFQRCGSLVCDDNINERCDTLVRRDDDYDKDNQKMADSSQRQSQIKLLLMGDIKLMKPNNERVAPLE